MLLTLGMNLKLIAVIKCLLTEYNIVAINFNRKVEQYSTMRGKTLLKQK